MTDHPEAVHAAFTALDELTAHQRRRRARWLIAVTAAALASAVVGCDGDSDVTPPGAVEAGAPGNVEAGAPGNVDASIPTNHRFRKLTLHREFYCEGASYGDLDADGDTDVIAGPHWYEGPDFTAQHEIWTAGTFDPTYYSDCFFQWVRDFNGDALLDVLVVGFPGTDASWFENPGVTDGAWIRHRVIDVVDNESPEFGDITGDGNPELLFASGGRLGWAGPDPADATLPWQFHALSDDRGYARYMHGLGHGDLNGDGREDVLEATGWFEQPAALENDPLWTRHDQPFGFGGAQMGVTDVDGDGSQDVVTTLSAHDYGLAWYEGNATNSAFTEHIIVSLQAPLPDAEVVLHEPHALALADIDADGLPDIVTGERFWGHAPMVDPDFTAPARLYWFRLERTASGARWTPYLIDDDSGVGTQVTVGDVTDDGLPDIIVANKKGAFVFVHELAP